MEKKGRGRERGKNETHHLDDLDRSRGDDARGVLRGDEHWRNGDTERSEKRSAVEASDNGKKERRKRSDSDAPN